ncbi:MAG TPA: hypothetical protein VM656_03040, partial [Pyrinomonadaceae bacterium]|nr:hypothetical protein [Pyrinomonadaceae bacterium]
RVYIIALVMLGLLSVQVSSAKSTNATVIAKSSAAAALKPEGVRVSIELVADERRNNQSLASRIAKVPSGKSLYLVFKNLNTPKQPEELYNVYINLEEGKTPTAADTPAGTINFYNFAQKARSDAFFSFDVTEALKKLAAEKRLSNLVITIVPAAPPADGVVPTIGQIELVEQ